MSSDDEMEIKDFVERGQAAQADVDKVIENNRATRAAEVIERLATARAISIPPRPGAALAPTLAELFADAVADTLVDVPPKKRRQLARRLARLEQEIRRELGRAWTDALNEGNWARAAGGEPAQAWAYHLGCLNGALIAFLGRAGGSK